MIGGRARLAIVPAARWVVADEAYDADDVLAFLAPLCSEAVISPMPTRRRTTTFDLVSYRERDIIELAFCSLKDCRGITTRYDKIARNFLVGSALATAVAHWTE